MEQVFHAQQLLHDLSAWMLGLIPAGGGLMLGYHALMRNTAQDDQAAAMHTRTMRNVVIGTAIGEGAAGLIRFFSGYVG